MSSLAKSWWRERQFSFNALVVLSLVLAFIAFAVVANVEDSRLPSQGADHDIGGYALICPCCSATIFLAAANLCYSYAHGIERFLGVEHPDQFRIRAWRRTTLLFCAIPFLIPIFLALRLFV